MRRFALCGVFLSLGFFGGCARVRVTTEIKPDGSWARTLALTGQEKQEGGASMRMAPALDELLVLPSGTEWKSRKEKQKGDDVTLFYERTFAAGASVKGDLSIKDEAPGKLRLVNEAAVTRAARRIEYKEVLRWQGTPPKDLGKMKPEDLAQIKAALPGALATDANAQALAEQTVTLLVPLLFGPGDPLLALSLLHPDLAERRATQRIGELVLKALETQFGDKIAAAQRREIARKLVASSFASTRPSQPDPAAGPPSKNSGGLIPLMFVLKAPGKVISTNGQIDEFTGEIYWALFPEAASMKEVSLTAVVELAGR